MFPTVADSCGAEENVESIDVSRAKIRGLEAKEVIEELAASILEDRVYLQEQCSQHGIAIRNRWKKKTTKKREELLL